MNPRTALAGAGTAALTLTLALTGLITPTASVAAAGAPAARTALSYVALGDSYSAASGVLPIDVTGPSCLRSTRNYPKVIAARTGAALTDVTCGAAETGDFFTKQNPDTPPQLDALSAGTKLVTMTIGGNDSNVFIGAILKCGTAGISTAGTGHPCQDRYGASFTDTIKKRTYPSLVRALTAVHRRAPQARVAILGYPWIVPTEVGCFPKLPIATGDVPYLRHLQAVLNDAVHRAATKTGSTYVDVPAASNGHDACQAIGTRWVEPVLGGTNPVIVHPNALGEMRLAGLTIAKLHLR